MNKRLTFVFLVACITGFGIVFFQLYWLSASFDSARKNFQRTASGLLQQTIDEYQLKQTSEILHFKPGDTTLSVGLPSSGRATSIKSQPVNEKGSARRDYQQFEQKLTRSNINTVKIMMARMIAQVTSKPVVLSVLETNYRRELLKNKIGISFTLSFIEPDSKREKFEVVGYSGLSGRSKVIRANFRLTTLTLIGFNLFPVIVSVGLILLASGCLYYMWHVIRRQSLLDDLKNDLINNLTHEFRTPVAILKSTHEAIVKFSDASEFGNVMRYISANQSVLNKLEANVDRILDITGYENNTKHIILTSFALKKLIQDILTAFELANDVKIRFTYEIKQETIYSDQFVIATIISNLIDNALKYGGPEVNIGLVVYPGTDGWVLAVSDDGPGIPKKFTDLIFDKFYRIPTGNVHDIKGYGIGLSYVKTLTGLLNGRMSVQSETGEGTTFKIEFPSNE